MYTPTLTNDTLIVLKVQFSEQSGSTKPVRLVKTVKDLGVVLPDGQVHLPTDEEAKAAVAQDRDFPGSNALANLLSKYYTANQAVGNPIVALRKALTDLIKGGAFLEDHKVNGKDYVWQGDEQGLSAQWRTDDAAGTETGIPNLVYLNFSGAAVWGDPNWQDDFNRIVNKYSAGLDPFAAVEDDYDWRNNLEDPEPENEEREAGNVDGVLTIRVPAGVRVVRIEIE